MSTQLTLHAVSKAYAHGRVLNAVSATVRDGERAAVVGENGAGKSTLLRLLAGQELPDVPVRLIPVGSASSPMVDGPSPSRIRMPRRAGSASEANTRSRTCW